MRRFFVAVVFVLILLAAALGVFIFTFDANRYKDVLIKNIEASTGKDVSIDSISLSILRGLRLEAKGIELKDKDKAWGDFLVKAKSMSVNLEILPLLKKDIQIQSLFVSELKLAQLKPSIEDVHIKAQLRNNGLVIKSLTGFIAGGSFSASGIIRDAAKAQEMDMDVKLNKARVSDFAPEMPAGSPDFKGLLSMDMKVQAKGLAQDVIIKGLKADGSAKLETAVLENMNVLKTAFDQLNMLPGLVQRLKDNLPEKYKPLLERNNTEFRPINTAFQIRDGRIYFEKLLVESDAFYLLSKGSVSMDKDLDISSVLFIPQDLSAALAGTVSELKYLQDAKGIITMPLEVTGRVPDISVMPDLNYVIQKLAVSKGVELLNKLFKSQEPQPENQ